MGETKKTFMQAIGPTTTTHELCAPQANYKSYLTSTPVSETTSSEKEYDNLRDLVFYLVRSTELREYLTSYFSGLLMKVNHVTTAATQEESTMGEYSDVLRDLLDVIVQLTFSPVDEMLYEDVIEAYQILGEFADKAELKEFKLFCTQNANELKQYIQSSHSLLFGTNQKTTELRFSGVEKELLAEFLQRIVVVLKSVNYAQEVRRGSVTSTTESSSDDEVCFVEDNSVEQLKTLIVPLVTSCLKNIQLNEMSFSDAKHNFKLSNVAIVGEDIVPDAFRMSTGNHKRTNVFHRSMSKIKISAANVKLSMSDVNYIYQRTKFPSFEDEGVADLILGGAGMKFSIVWRIYAKKERPVCIKLDQVKCSIDRMQMQIKDTNHTILLKVARKLFARKIRRRVEDMVTDVLKETLEPLGEKMNCFFKRVNQEQAEEPASLVEMVENEIQQLNSQSPATSYSSSSERNNSLDV